MSKKAANRKKWRAVRGRVRLVNVRRDKAGRVARPGQCARGAELREETLRMRAKHLGLSIEQAKHHECDLVSWRWLQQKQIQPHHHEAAKTWAKLTADWREAIKAPGRVPNGEGGMDLDPWASDPDYQAWCDRRRDAYNKARGVLLRSGPLHLLVADGVAVENKEMVTFIPEFREAMNVLARHFRISRETGY